jgi:hypothetical protein
MKKLRHYLNSIKRYVFLKILQYLFLDGPPQEIELWPKQLKFLGLGPLSRKKWLIELTLGG